MRLIVTGASGFIGQALLPFLAAQGHGGIATGRTVPPNLPPGWVGWCRQDVLFGKELLGCIDAVIHLEVKQHVPRPSTRDIQDFSRVNVGGTSEWLNWATANGTRRFVFTSSIKAVGGGRSVRLENDSRPPDTPYGRSKAEGEMLVRDWCSTSSDRTATILRVAPVYGPENDANLAAFVRQVLRGQPCFVGDGSIRKSVVSRRNLVSAIQFVLCQNLPGCEVYNVSDEETVSVRELADLVARLAKCRPPRSIPRAAALVIATLGDFIEAVTEREFPLTTARLRALCDESIFPSDKLVTAGFRHAVSLKAGLEEMLAWIRSSESAKS